MCHFIYVEAFLEKYKQGDLLYALSLCTFCISLCLYVTGTVIALSSATVPPDAHAQKIIPQGPRPASSFSFNHVVSYSSIDTKFSSLLHLFIFCNPILFAICTSTFSKLCKNMYTVACRRVLTSTPLYN
jgi:hypothetical protein